MKPPSLQLTPELSQWLSELYQQASALALAEFKHWCFVSIQPILAFDSGLWATRSDLTEMKREHWDIDTTLYHQTAEFMENYAKIDAKSDLKDPLNTYLVSHPGAFFTIWDAYPKDQWYKTAFYLEHCRQYGVENAISALVLPTEKSCVYHVLSFYRADRTDEFSEDETLLANFILPNLIQAFRINLLSAFHPSHENGESFRAVVDRYGEVVEAEGAFCDLMETKGLLDKTQIKIPALKAVTSSSKLEFQGLIFDIVFTNGLLYVEVSDGSLMEKLSGRQLDICRLLIKGLTNKQIANYLVAEGKDQNITFHTVSSHLQNIYKIIKVKNRAQATAYLIEHGLE